MVITMTPIGTMRTPFADTAQIPKGPDAKHEADGIIELDPALEAGLQDVEGFSHLYVLWLFHRAEGRACGPSDPSTGSGSSRAKSRDEARSRRARASDSLELRRASEASRAAAPGGGAPGALNHGGAPRALRYDLIAHPPSDDRPHGVFATRSPQRPNPIGLTVVQLLRRDGSRLHVRGVDMLDGTPVLDIKPYLSSIPIGEIRRGWLADAEERRRSAVGGGRPEPAP